MSRNFLSWDDASVEAGNNRQNARGSTQSRIFGGESEAIEKPLQHPDQAPIKEIEKEKDPVFHVQSELDRNKQQNQSTMFSEGNQGSAKGSSDPHVIRYSSFFENQSNSNKIREQKLIQKQWLDNQIAERKSLDRKTKKSDDLFEESVSKSNALSSSESARHKSEKHDMQHQIREYNELLASQKRANDKKIKDMDKQETNGNYQKASKQDLQKEEANRQRVEDAMIEKERALSRDMRQMNTNN